MNFAKLQTEIENYISANYPASLTDNLAAPEFINELPIDLDQYTADNQMFFDFENYEFETLSNESNKQTINFTTYVVCQNSDLETLKKNVLGYTSNFYDFVQTSNGFGGLVDQAQITKINFYYDVEANSNIKAAAIELSLTIEEN